MERDTNEIYYSKFVIDDKPHCIWGADLDFVNRDFVDKLDADYFDFQGRTFARLLDGDQRLMAAVALRSAYSHALESFFALLFAAIQAPGCVPAWLARYTTTQLRSVVRKVDNREPIRASVTLEKSDQDLPWSGLAATVMPVSEQHVAWRHNIRRGVGWMWGRFAQDLLDPYLNAEYNWIKHGLRVTSGGFELNIGLDSEAAGESPHRLSRPIGASEFGCTTYQPDPIDDAPNHFSYIYRASNWAPQNHIAALTAISVFVGNVRSFLKVENRYGTGRLNLPDTSEFYSAPWQPSVGLTPSFKPSAVKREQIEVFSKEDILAECNSQEI